MVTIRSTLISTTDHFPSSLTSLLMVIQNSRPVPCDDHTKNRQMDIARVFLKSLLAVYVQNIKTSTADPVYRANFT